MHKREVAEISPAALIISDSTIDVLPGILKILPKFCSVAIFSIVIGGRLDSSKFFKGTQLKRIFSNFPKLLK